MITQVNALPIQPLLNKIIALQKAVGVIITEDNIRFAMKNPETSYYMVNGKSQGRVYLDSYTKRGEDNARYVSAFEVQLSADDLNGNFHLFKNIKKAVHWYLDDKLNLKQQLVVIQEKLNENQPFAYCLQIAAYLDGKNQIEKITYMYYGYDKKEDIVIEKTGSKLMSIEDETLIARYRYQKFMQPDAFNQMFDDIEGPPLNPLTREVIESRLSVLEAIKY